MQSHAPPSLIFISDIEAAINFWRAKSPSTDGVSLCPELRTLAEVYGLLIYYRCDQIEVKSFPSTAYDAWLTWYETTTDTPCIAICSTSQGDAHCKGCGRSFEEVQNWPEMSPADKRAVWHRITFEGSAWRFNRYAERAQQEAPFQQRLDG